MGSGVCWLLKPAARLGYFRRLLGRTRTLDSQASRLRRKLNASAETAYVLNVWGVGYRLVATSS
jgi:DNA-binding response OmpR family regulator